MTLGFGGGVRNNALFLALAQFGRVVTVYGGLKKCRKSIKTPSDFLPMELVLGKGEKIDLELVSQLSGVRNFELLVCRYYRNYWVARHLDIPFRFVDADDLRKTQYLNIKGIVKRYVMHAAEIFRRCIIRSHLLMANQVFYVTSSDKGLFSSNYTYLPNVVPLPEVRWLGAEGLRKTILLVGNFNYGPNLHGLAWLIEKVWPKVRSRYDSESLILRVVGNIDDGAKQEYLDADGVEFAGFVEDISQEYLSCSLAVSPVSIGSGSQIKLLEAMSFGVPILARSYAKGGFRLRSVSISRMYFWTIRKNGVV